MSYICILLLLRSLRACSLGVVLAKVAKIHVYDAGRPPVSGYWEVCFYVFRMCKKGVLFEYGKKVDSSKIIKGGTINMKRSEINKALKDMEALVKKYSFSLPPFCHFTPEEWKEKGHEYDEIRDNMLGWDITDYGLGDFEKVGFALITLRNGNQHNPKYKKVYAEKLLMIKEGQHSPMHFHWQKSEDIINRGGGTETWRKYYSMATSIP